MDIFSDDFAAVDVREVLCYHSLTEKANPEVFQKENSQKRKPRSSSGPAAMGAVKGEPQTSGEEYDLLVSSFLDGLEKLKERENGQEKPAR